MTGSFASYQGALVHLDPGPRRIGTASGLKMDISLGPILDIKSELEINILYQRARMAYLYVRNHRTVYAVCLTV